MLRGRLEQHFNRIWYQQARPPLLYRLLSRIHARLPQARFRRPTARPPVPVIVVGNLTVGGGGKTPLVIALARHLLAGGHRVAVISRGYGGTANASPKRVQRGDRPARVGDEPLLVADQTDAPVWIGRQRAQVLEAAVSAGANVIISDDGLQHTALARSFEICLIDGGRGLGNGELLPAGPLRQPASRLDQVDLVLVKGEGQGPAGAVRVDLVPECLTVLGNEERLTLDDWRGRRVNAVCGIANPDGFFRTLKALDMTVEPHAFPDHHRFKKTDMEGLDGSVVVTAKDAVKLRGLGLEQTVYVLHVALDLPEAVITAVDRHLSEWNASA